ncbi:hypothetical protein BS78_05G278100 [Paspalum vaginatum]|nr:hypothetical protein BS78_05G278100 [Paspalum vaginatum]
MVRHLGDASFQCMKTSFYPVFMGMQRSGHLYFDVFRVGSGFIAMHCELEFYYSLVPYINASVHTVEFNKLIVFCLD